MATTRTTDVFAALVSGPMFLAGSKLLVDDTFAQGEILSVGRVTVIDRRLAEGARR